jgi:hypothetical protein
VQRQDHDLRDDRLRRLCEHKSYRPRDVGGILEPGDIDIGEAFEEEGSEHPPVIRAVTLTFQGRPSTCAVGGRRVRNGELLLPASRP